MESWGQRINNFFKDHPVPWSIVECSSLNHGECVIDLEGKTVFNICGEDADMQTLVDYINFEAGKGH